jgi:hypothetical protein
MLASQERPNLALQTTGEIEFAWKFYLMVIPGRSPATRLEGKALKPRRGRIVLVEEQIRFTPACSHN